jgi:hypothetical protein
VTASTGRRILGEVTKQYAELLRQAFAVFLPVRSVAVIGDGRRHDLITCRALCDLFNAVELRGRIAFRAGTAIRHQPSQLICPSLGASAKIVTSDQRSPPMA